MATKSHKFLSPPGQCIEIFNGGGTVRLLTATTSPRGGQAARAEQGRLMSIASRLADDEAEDDELLFADEDDEEMMDALLPPFSKR